MSLLSRFSRADSTRFAMTSLISMGAIACATTGSPVLGGGDECFPRIAYALAADDMEGRGIGTKGLTRAENYVRDRYVELGLDALRYDSPAPTYRQAFEATIGVRAGKGNALRWRHANATDGPIAETDVAFREQFMPFGFSSSGPFAGEAAFVGYGIVAEGLKTGEEADPFDYDDYAGVELAGRVAVAMRYEPQEDDADSPFDGKRPSRFSDLRYKALKAREAGAIALLFFTPPGEAEERLPRTGKRGAVSQAGLPVMQVSREVVRRWFEAAGEDLDALHAQIDASLEPRSRRLPGIEIEGMADVNATETSLHNVIAALPGQGALARETVVIGAHLDHLGFGGPSSLDPESKAVHNGADDNASGIAAMLCAVADVKERLEGDPRPRRTLVVAAFNGEESGLLGSNHYVRNAPRPIEDTISMVNLDMVGRLRNNRLHALGTDSSPDWNDILEPIARLRGFDLVSGGDGYGPSDQMSFYGVGVPVVHYFTGSHSEYHTPQDDPQLLNIPGGQRITRAIADTLNVLLTREARLEYKSSAHGPTMAGDSRGFGAYLGTVPDYADMMSREGGVLLSSVRPGAPADQAGIRGGDRIIEIDGTRIHNLHDMTFVLRDHRPGEVVEVVVVRGDETLTLRATLGRRGKRTKAAADSPHGSPHGPAPESPNAAPPPGDPHATTPEPQPSTQPEG